jgi:hypothetical protein
MFSVSEYLERTANAKKYSWERVGTEICYYSNQYSSTRKKNRPTQSNYHSTSFTIHFKHSNDVCYIAYHYPYTYAALRVSELVGFTSQPTL